MNDPAPQKTRRTLVRVIRGYQALSAGRQPRCRYLPTCSQYAIEAIDAQGAVRGGWLAIRRLGRCHPWGGSGFDPTPLTNKRSVPVPVGSHACEGTHS